MCGSGRVNLLVPAPGPTPNSPPWVSVLSAESGADWEAYFNTGMTWAVTPTWQVDGGVRLGLTDASTDFTPFLGLSTKF